MCKCRTPKPHPGTPVPTSRQTTVVVSSSGRFQAVRPNDYPPENGNPPPKGGASKGASQTLPIRVRR